MSSELIEAYHIWLRSQIRTDQDAPDQEYTEVALLMFEKEFVPLIPLDDNRVVDGRDLRAEFCFQKGLPTDRLDHLGPGASFLEVLIGLSRRLSFATDSDARSWAWQLMQNLELHKKPDPLTRRKFRQIEGTLEACIWRTYRPDGLGGFFPLAWPTEDQRKVEIHYQMAAYIDELHPEH